MVQRLVSSNAEFSIRVRKGKVKVDGLGIGEDCGESNRSREMEVMMMMRELKE